MPQKDRNGHHARGHHAEFDQQKDQTLNG